jgi:8-oxo-dGTP diphosphatase
MQVLLVHRPRYQDWGLPKGKLDANELAPLAAIREFHEETGLKVNRLSLPLGIGRYHVGIRPKVVRWWLADVTDTSPCRPLDLGEIDQASWLPVTKAANLLAHADERLVLQRALATPTTVPLLIARHAKAVDRAKWVGADTLRTLSPKGYRQANILRRLLAAYGVGELASSSSLRCLETFTPYSVATGINVMEFPQLSEDGALADPNAVLQTMHRLRDRTLTTGVSLAVCGHRPVLPAMIAALNLSYDPMKPADTMVAHLNPIDGTLVATERHHLVG